MTCEERERGRGGEGRGGVTCEERERARGGEGRGGVV